MGIIANLKFKPGIDMETIFEMLDESSQHYLTIEGCYFSESEVDVI